MNQAPGRMYLKVTGILSIIGGVILLLSGIVLVALGNALASAGIGTGAFDFGDIGGVTGIFTLAGGAINLTVGMISVFGVIALIAGVCNLIIGIFGVKNSNKPEKAGVCFVLGILMLVFSAIGILTNFTNGFSLYALISGLAGCILPVCYTYGAYLNKKAAQNP